MFPLLFHYVHLCTAFYHTVVATAENITKDIGGAGAFQVDFDGVSSVRIAWVIFRVGDVTLLATAKDIASVGITLNI